VGSGPIADLRAKFFTRFIKLACWRMRPSPINCKNSAGHGPPQVGSTRGLDKKQQIGACREQAITAEPGTPRPHQRAPAFHRGVARLNVWASAPPAASGVICRARTVRTRSSAACGRTPIPQNVVTWAINLVSYHTPFHRPARTPCRSWIRPQGIRDMPDVRDVFNCDPHRLTLAFVKNRAPAP
jgi:hypothetical protein